MALAVSFRNALGIRRNLLTHRSGERYLVLQQVLGMQIQEYSDAQRIDVP